MRLRHSLALALIVALPSAGIADEPAPTQSATAPAPIPRAKVTGITVYLAMPDGSTLIQNLDAAKVNGLYWSDRAARVLNTHCAKTGATTTLNGSPIEATWNTPDANGYLPAFLSTEGACQVSACEFPAPADQPTPLQARKRIRPKITAIQLYLTSPSGKQRVNTVDPHADAVMWGDESVPVLASFYAPGNPAEGKRMDRETFLNNFPHAGCLIGDQDELLITPEVIERLWKLPKRDGTAVAFMSKMIWNPSNGAPEDPEGGD